MPEHLSDPLCPVAYRKLHHRAPRQIGVLVVDDEALIRALLERTLPQHGFTVWTAANAQEAVDIYRCYQDDIAIVLLGVNMPFPDGPQTLRVLQQLNSDICCCFMSGYLGSYSVTELTTLGAAAVFEKPFRVVEIAQTLRQIAQQAAAGCPG